MSEHGIQLDSETKSDNGNVDLSNVQSGSDLLKANVDAKSEEFAGIGTKRQSDDDLYSGLFDTESTAYDLDETEEEHEIKEKPGEKLSASTSIDSTVQLTEGSEILSELKIDRHTYYEIYNHTKSKLASEKIKNAYLMKLMVAHYRRRRMLHVLVPDQHTPTELTDRYEKLLEEYETINEQFTIEQVQIEMDIGTLEIKYKNTKKQTEALFTNLQEMEEKSVPAEETTQRVLERYLHRQREQLDSLIKLRLEYYGLLQKYNEKQVKLDALDNLGPNCRLIDYEQLKVDNLNLKDKLEAKQQMMTKTRNKLRGTMQVLAHTREKIDNVKDNINKEIEDYQIAVEDYSDVRENLTDLKIQRDSLRKNIQKIKENAGLLTKKDLVLDMCRTIEEVEVAKNELRQLKDDFYSKTQMMEETKVHLSDSSSSNLWELN